MTLHDTIRLVKSLTTSEKRLFTIASRRQTGPGNTAKEYIALYQIISSLPADEKQVRKLFKEKYPGHSLVNTTQYLSRVVMTCLVSSKTEKDIFFQTMQNILECKILQDRSLYDEALNRTRQIRRNIRDAQQPWLEYFSYRHELDYYAEQDFHGISDQELIGLQMKAKEVLRNLNHIQDHHALFELLKYRLVHSGKISSDEERKKMNDLMLSEMTLVAGKTKNSFLSSKLHLMFQSFFFMNTGDYQTALKTFSSLNTLFEKNLGLLDYPPMDYLSALDGIIDSLYTLQTNDEIYFYLDKARRLDQAQYPEYFRLQVRKMIMVYELAMLIREQEFDKAVQYIGRIDQPQMTMYNMLSDEKQWELYFYCSLANLKMHNLKKAHDFILQIMQHEKPQAHLLICRAVRLLNIIIYYEKRDSQYLAYEIRSYKRFFAKQPAAFRSEKLLLRFISHWPDKKAIRLTVTDRRKIQEEVKIITNDKYERQLTKYFNFSDWVQSKITK